MNPFFSIIIPTYNRADLLQRALASIEKQIFRDFETIVCDDGSTDRTQAVIDSFADRMDIRYIWENNWGGPARPRNNGLKNARGEWVCFLDADDWWYPDKLSNVHGNTSGSDLIYHNADRYISSGKKLLLQMRSRTVHKPIFVDMMTRGNPIITSSVSVRRSIFEEVGGFSEDASLISVEDFDLWLRVSMITDRFIHIPRALCGYWAGGDNISSSSSHISAHQALFNRYRSFLSPADQREAEKYFSYSMGLTALRGKSFEKCREFMTLSMRSHNPRLSGMSMIRIMESLWRQVSQ